MDRAEAQSLLGVDASASDVRLKAAYRDALKVWHPDRALGDPARMSEAHARTQRLNAAYTLLKAESHRPAAQGPADQARGTRTIRTIDSSWWPARAIASDEAPITAGLLVFALAWAAMVGTALALEIFGLI